MQLRVFFSRVWVATFSANEKIKQDRFIKRYFEHSLYAGFNTRLGCQIQITCIDHDNMLWKWKREQRQLFNSSHCFQLSSRSPLLDLHITRVSDRLVSHLPEVTRDQLLKYDLLVDRCDAPIAARKIKPLCLTRAGVLLV